MRVPFCVVQTRTFSIKNYQILVFGVYWCLCRSQQSSSFASRCLILDVYRHTLLITRVIVIVIVVNSRRVIRSSGHICCWVLHLFSAIYKSLPPFIRECGRQKSSYPRERTPLCLQSLWRGATRRGRWQAACIRQTLSAGVQVNVWCGQVSDSGQVSR